LPTLSEEQIHEISQSAERIIKTLPEFDPKLLSQKKDINKQINVRNVYVYVGGEYKGSMKTKHYTLSLCLI